MDFPQWLAASRLRVEAVLREALAARLPMSTPDLPDGEMGFSMRPWPTDCSAAASAFEPCW